MITRVERIDNRLYSFAKPRIESIETLYLGKNGTLILAAGFEDRALGVLNLLKASNSKGFKTILIEYKPRLEENKILEITELCREMGSEIIPFPYDRYDPSGGGEILVQSHIRGNGPIFFDISAASRFLIVQLLVALGKSQHRFTHTKILYTEAVFYPPTQAEIEKQIEKSLNCSPSIFLEYFISSGVYDVSVTPELSSIASFGQPVRLIMFPSFNCDQLSSLKGDLHPFYYCIIHGIPPAPENAWRPDAIKRINRIDEIKKNIDQKDASTLYYSETLDYLLEIYDKYTDLDRLVIAPTGSKMQSVAVGIFRTFMDDVQIVYPIPKKFTSPKRYTEGIKNIYELNLEPFNILFDKDF